MIKKLVEELKKKTSNRNKVANQSMDNDIEEQRLQSSLQANLQTINTILGNSADIVIREFTAEIDRETELAVVYIDGLADERTIQHFILDALMTDPHEEKIREKAFVSNDPFEFIKLISLTASDVTNVTDFSKLIDQLLSGNTLLLIDGVTTCLACNTPGWEMRAIEEPSNQTVIRGPKEGFTETMRTNTALIRRRIKDSNLRIERRVAGRRTKTDIAIVFIQDIANPKIVEEVRNRLNRIDIDAILESGYIEELIQDEAVTPFPTVYHTERPDVIAAGILEGRIAIVVDGTPFALLVPAIFVQFMQSAEDYYHRFDIASIIRLLRFVAIVLALLTPSFYIAITTFHQEMLPTLLLISLVAQREAVPFPAIIEAMLMEFTFEVLREAGVRMPRAIGPAISIVGALVLGDAAVRAGLVSPAMVIVVSLTAISSFVIPSYNLAITIRILRFLFMIVAAAFGLFGIILGVLVMMLHLCSLRSFGVPYMTPFAPFVRKDLKDTFLRFPFWAMKLRPHRIGNNNLVRENTPHPKPPSPDEQ